jgi:hypothetical protein
MSSSVRDGEHGKPNESQLAKVAATKNAGLNRSGPSDDEYGPMRYRDLQGEIKAENASNETLHGRTPRSVFYKAARLARDSNTVFRTNPKLTAGKGRKSRKHRGTRRRKTHRRRR